MATKQEIETMVVKPKIILKYDETDYQILETESESNLDNQISNIRDFMLKNDAKGKSDSIKNTTYGDAQKIWGNFRNSLDTTKFNFFLDKEQFEYLMNLLKNKFEYDVNAVFYILELTSILGEIESDGKKGFKENKYIGFKLTATDITYMYHILAQYKVKGLNRGTVLFANIIRRIGEISKLFDYYNNITKELSTEIVDWVAQFDENVSIAEAKTEIEGTKKSKKVTN